MLCLRRYFTSLCEIIYNEYVLAFDVSFFDGHDPLVAFSHLLADNVIPFFKHLAFKGSLSKHVSPPKVCAYSTKSLAGSFVREDDGDIIIFVDCFQFLY